MPWRKQSRVTGQVAPNVKVIEQEIKLATGKTLGLKPGQISLRGNDHKDAKDEGQQNPLETLGYVLPAAANSKCKPGRCASQQEKKRNLPLIEKCNDRVGEEAARSCILGVKGVPDIKDAR